jgi:hypothetical protein
MSEPDDRSRKNLKIGFGIGMAIGAFVTGFLFNCIPHENSLTSVPEVTLLITATMPILLWQSLSPPGAARKISAIASCIIWIAGIGVAFLIKPGTNLIYVPDALMLLGFVPLLYAWRFSWPWLVFGAINFGIGVFLQAIAFIPDSYFPQNLWPPKHHLAEYHPSITWWVFGGFALTFGIVRLFKNLSKLARRPAKQPVEQTGP